MPRLLLVAGAAVILMAMTGCVDPAPPVTPSPTPSATPVFASEEEALAAAEAAYREYLAVSDAISAEGGENPERLDAYVTEEKLREYSSEFQALRSSGKHMEGASKFDTVTLQRYDSGEVALYLCLDVSGVRVRDGANIDVTPPDRLERVPLEVSFVVVDRLLLQSSDVWERESYCS